MAHRLAIRRFVEHFQRQIPELDAVQPIMYRKVLYATALDPLARAAFGNDAGRHRQRVVRLIDELTTWAERDRISLPQLELHLRNESRARHRLSREVRRRLRHWPPGSVVPLSASPDSNALMPFADAAERKMISNCRYAHLFYTYRNNLIHEFREPGYGIEFSSDKDNPYYHGLIGEPWQLVFPVGFFASIFASALSGLKAYLMDRDQDPMAQFEFGSLWRA